MCQIVPNLDDDTHTQAVKSQVQFIFPFINILLSQGIVNIILLHLRTKGMCLETDRHTEAVSRFGVEARQ